MHLELRIPEAATYVLGDSIPLTWSFRNTSTEPLGFLWEGCCRKNGQLEVTLNRAPISAIPPATALAHMFAKAERLEAGASREFETRVSDWVLLRDTGRYLLKGRYRGVLPEQSPQVPRGLKLWRGEAESPNIELAVLTVRDYLAERERRADQRGLRVEISGPDQFRALTAAIFRIKVHNTTRTEKRLVWPTDIAIWMVNGEGKRVAAGSGSIQISGDQEEMRLAAGSAIEREMVLDPDAFEGEPFGTYQVFAEVMAAGVDEPRVPSNALAVNWRLDAGALIELIEQAARGGRTGLRNPALKLLRVHLGSLDTALSNLSARPWPSSARPLYDQLRLAACLKPLKPEPGNLELVAEIAIETGDWRWEQSVSKCFDVATPPLAQAVQVLEVRRHLGWEVAPILAPEGSVTVGTILRIADELRSLPFSGAPQVRIRTGASNVAGIFLPGQLTQAEWLVRIAAPGGTVSVTVAKNETGGGALSIENIRRANFASPRESLASLLAGKPTSQTAVFAATELSWQDISTALEPFWRLGWPIDLFRWDEPNNTAGGSKK